MSIRIGNKNKIKGSNIIESSIITCNSANERKNLFVRHQIIISILISFLGLFAQPKQSNPNPFFIGEEFGFVIYL